MSRPPDPPRLQELFVDTGLVVVMKPSGLATIPERQGNPGDCVWRRLEQQREERLWVVHRLDKGTSGLLLFARSAEHHAALCGLFEHRKLQKCYLALCRPQPNHRVAGRIDSSLDEGRRGQIKIAGSGRGRPALTHFRVLGYTSEKIAVVEARPHTGRRHQLRVHLASVGLPLVCDRRYGREAPLQPDGAEGIEVQRLALHAWKLKGLKQGVMEAPWPADLEYFLAPLVQRLSFEA